MQSGPQSSRATAASAKQIFISSLSEVFSFILTSPAVLRHSPMASEEGGSSSQFAQLLSAIQRVEANVDAKLSQMKQDLREERETSDERLVKKIRLDKKPTFRKVSHEK